MKDHLRNLFHFIKNEVNIKPLWVEVWVNGEEIATIDWNNKPAVRMFAEMANNAIRDGEDVRTIPTTQSGLESLGHREFRQLYTL